MAARYCADRSPGQPGASHAATSAWQAVRMRIAAPLRPPRRAGSRRTLLTAAALALGAVPTLALAGTAGAAATLERAVPVSGRTASMCGPLAPPAGGQPCGPGNEIQFPRGESSWSFHGGIWEPTQVWYFSADAGQLLQLNFAAADRNVSAHVFAPNGAELLTWSPDEWGYQDVMLPAKGQYAIVLYTGSGSAYGMSMGIDSISPVTLGYYGRIEVVDDGENNAASVENSVLANDRDVWVFDARSGQSAALYLGSLEANAIVEIYNPYGELIGTADTEWYDTLTVDGTYTLMVSSTARNASYELALMLPGGTTPVWHADAPPAGNGGTVGQIPEPGELSEYTDGKQIRFAPGTNNGVLSGWLAAGTGDGWELRAGAGQRVIIDLLGDFVTVELYTADGRALLTRGDSNAQAVADLPVSGTYYLYVWAPAEAAANFELRITIP